MNGLGNIVVIGVTGSGKTTLARKIAARTNRVHIDLDDCHWSPGWVSADADEFKARIAVAIKNAQPKEWVIAGNYSKARDFVWGQTQTIVALDYSFPISFWRIFSRSIKRIVTREKVCNGNVETFAKTFMDKDSILLWFFQTFYKRRRALQALIDTPGEYAHLRIIRMTNPKMTEQWLNTLT